MAAKKHLTPVHVILIGFLILLFFTVNQYSDVVKTLAQYADADELAAILAGRLRIHLALNIAATAVIAVFVAYATDKAVRRQMTIPPKPR